MVSMEKLNEKWHTLLDCHENGNRNTCDARSSCFISCVAAAAALAVMVCAIFSSVSRRIRALSSASCFARSALRYDDGGGEPMRAAEASWRPVCGEAGGGGCVDVLRASV